MAQRKENVRSQQVLKLVHELTNQEQQHLLEQLKFVHAQILERQNK